MCAIAGIQGKGSREVLGLITDAMAHRGPDAEGHWSDENAGIYLGHRRLSIVDLENGAQPMLSRCGRYVVTFNGEIYNHLDLKRELEALGRKFVSSHSDTEVLLNAYAEWGQEMLSRLNGMWAFAIYDREKEEIFLSRDRFGEKPLYYSMSPQAFVFASELTALSSHPSVSSRVSDLGLRKFFAYGYIPAPHTAIEGAKKLPAAHWMRYDCRSGKAEIRRYWRYQIEPSEEFERADERDLDAELLRLLGNSVQLRLMADVPAGVFLSGGVDSSAVAALAVGGDREIDTFSIGFEEASFDESGYARTVANHLGTRHHCGVVNGDKVAGLSNTVLGQLDEPLGDASLVATWLLCQYARENVKVALGGDGSDELLCGYDPFKALSYAKVYGKLMPRPMHEAIVHLSSRLPVSHRNMSLDFKVKRALRGVGHHSSLWAPVWMSSLSGMDFDEFTNASESPESIFSEAIEAWEGCQSDRMEDRLSQFFVELYLQDDILTKVDRASMRHGLEVRSPFLDNDVVEFIRRLPTRSKFNGGVGKRILRNAIAKKLPREVLTRPKKGFGMPVGKWFKEGVLTPGQANWGNQTTADRLQSRHLDGRSDERAFLWNLYVTNRWAGHRESLCELAG